MAVPPLVLAALIAGVVAFVIGLIALIFALLVYTEEDDKTIPEMYEEKRDTVVSVLVVNSDDSSGTGSGFFISPDGYIATSGHNLYDYAPPHDGEDITHKPKAVWVSVTNWNGTGEHRTVPVTVVGVDGTGDVGLVKVEGVTNHNYLTFCDNRLATPGSTCVVIGDPKGVDHQSCSVGVVRDEMYTHKDGATPNEQIFIDASTLPGNSGSPIVNPKGEVLGILNFGVPYTTILPAVQENFGGGSASSVMEPVLTRMMQDHKNGTNEWTSGAYNDYNLKGYLGLRWDSVEHRHVVHHSSNSGLDHTAFNHRGIVVQDIDAAGGVGPVQRGRSSRRPDLRGCQWAGGLDFVD